MISELLLSEVSPNPKHAVYKAGEFYTYLAMSVKDRGVLMPILVRNIKGGYEVVKGLHRYHAALDAGHVYIAAQIINATDAEVEEIRLIASTQIGGIEPRAIQRTLLKICESLPYITLTGMAKKLKKNPKWIREHLMLEKLNPHVADMVNNEKIWLMNAWILTKLEDADQLNYLGMAQTVHPDQFYEVAKARTNEVRALRRAKFRGQVANKVCIAHINREFFLDGVSDGTEIQFVYEDCEIAQSLSGCKTIEEARVVLQEPPKVDYYWVITSIQFKDRVIV